MIQKLRVYCFRLVSPGTATEHSEKCCQTIVNAGAVEILLKQINLLNRGVPDQEVLKQVLFTLRNIARFRNLQPVLANTPQAVEIVFQELLRYPFPLLIVQLLIRYFSFLVSFVLVQCDEIVVTP